MNPVDTVLQTSFPTVMVPSREPLAKMVRPGERLLVATDGVYLEVLRPWLRVVRRIAVWNVSTAVPYGTMEEAAELLCPPVPPSLLESFRLQAGRACPDETGAWIVWNAITGLFRLVELEATSRGPGHLVYVRPELRDGEHCVVDCHSHGTGEAFFSRTDNDDDRHDVKFAFVLGYCDREATSTALRLCIKGRFEKFDQLPQAWTAALDAEVR
jgi:PRTRC genetic system protein A